MALGIKTICDFKTLLSWLSSEMNWITGIDDFEDIDDITYDFDARDIHLKPEEFAKITSLKQLRPLHEKQPWGIFAVEFESKRFEISSLRKILSGLVPKRRNRDHAVWEKKNLLFFCFWGEKNNRCFGAVYFEDKTNALPSIKTLHIAPKSEDPINLQNFEDNFKKLTWSNLSQKPSLDDYRECYDQWTGAFTTVYRQVIGESSLLTVNLAEIALRIRQKILDIFAVETENGAIHELYHKFRKALIHDMTEEQFADMYAQTMVYGLFSARCMSDRLNNLNGQEDENKTFDPKRAIDSIPSTNPFLQNLLKESFSRKNKLSFDELDLGDITLLLQNTDTKRIIDDFNRQTGGGKEDPVIYFYEGFLNAYEKKQKKHRGVYYTPMPVVKFMVQAVDDILKTEFAIKDGLASIEKKTISVPKKKGGEVVAIETKEVPAIQILDPAVGTATYLRQIILQIWENFKKANAEHTKKSIQGMWNIYVKNNLLPRLNGFELMMAPYAVAHMKLALVLLDTGYAFDEDEKHPDRVKVFLTNSLEEADKDEGQNTMFEHDALAEESRAAKETKKNRGINVVIGNPPYSGESANKGDWILSLLEDYKKEPGGIDKLQEKNPKWINDDYVKFIRYAQLYVERAGSGIVAYINNHSFLDNPTFRGMRWNLLKGFDKIYIIDLHGNAKKKETASDGGKDENIFDIQQGVSINIFVKNENDKADQLAEVFHHDLYGLRDYKYDFLNSQNINSIKWNTLALSAPQYFFVQKNFENQARYEEGFCIEELLSINGVGITTAHDNFVISSSSKELFERFTKFKESPGNAELLHKNFDVQEKKGWDILKGWKNLQSKNNLKTIMKNISYRPFDTRFIFYESKLIWRSVERIMSHFINGKNIGLIFRRQQLDIRQTYYFISKYIIADGLIRSDNKGGESIAPLYLYEGKRRRPNLHPKIITAIEQKLNLSFVAEKDDSATLASGGFKDSSFAPDQLIENTFSPIDLFDYIYAVLHSPAYRETYREFLKIDFPRVPYPANQQKFWKLVALGGRLRELHLLESPEFEEIALDSTVSGKVPVSKIRYLEGKVLVNDVFCFEDVPLTAWEFYIGGYQPAQKWLKDRKGCILEANDIKHYRKIVLALTRTAQIMAEIDEVGVV